MSHIHTNTTQAPHLAEDRFELSSLIQFQGKDDLIWITPVCEFFKIGYDHHRKLIKNDPILQSIQRKNADYLAFGDKRQRILLPKVGFLRWIQLINPTTVRPELREKFLQFQTMVFDYLYGSAKAREEETALYREQVMLENERARINARLKTIRARHKVLLTQRYLGHGTQTTMQLEGGAA